MNIIYDTALVGRTVIDASGRAIGQVDGLAIDLGSWKVLAVRVKLERSVSDEIGASHGPFRAARLDVPSEFIQNVADTVVLTGPVSALRTFEQPAPTP